MKYAVEMDSSGMKYIPSFIKSGTDIEAVLRFFFRNFEMMQCLYYCREDL